jgi:hypothetical protein
MMTRNPIPERILTFVVAGTGAAVALLLLLPNPARNCETALLGGERWGQSGPKPEAKT